MLTVICAMKASEAPGYAFDERKDLLLFTIIRQDRV